MHANNGSTAFASHPHTRNQSPSSMQPHFQQQQHLQPPNIVILDPSTGRLSSCSTAMAHQLFPGAPNGQTTIQQQYGTPLSLSDGTPSPNVVFAWNSPSRELPQELAYSQYTRNIGVESQNGGTSARTRKQLRSGAMTTPARSCYNNGFGVAESEGVGRGAKPSKTRVQTSVRTTTTSPQSVGGNPSTVIRERSCSPHNEQLRAQLEHTHQMFRDGLLDSKEYHQRVADLMVQVHTGGMNTNTNNNNMYPVANNNNQLVLPTRLVSTESGMGVMGNIPCPQTVMMPHIDQSQYASMLNPLGGIAMNPNGGGQATTTTTTTTTTRKRSSNLARSVSGRRRGHRNMVQSNRYTMHAVALSPTDLLLVFKLLEKEQGTVSSSQIVALFYTLVADAARALQQQLKLNPKSNGVAPELKRILSSGSAASCAADELGSFANSLYKTLKRARIDGLKSKHNRLRLLATEASTRKWQGAELLTFVAQLLAAMDRDLTPAERITVIKALVDKLKRRAGSSGSLGELYRAFEFIFPGTNEESEFRLSQRRRERVGLRSLTFSNDLCHGCDQKLVGFRFRCLDCHNAAIAQGLDTPSASKRALFTLQKRSGKHRTKVEYLLCSECFVASHSDQAEDNNQTLEDSFVSSPRGTAAALRHRNPSSCAREFVCEVPFSVVSTSSLAHRPLGHLCMAPVQGWRSPGAATAMVFNNRVNRDTSPAASKQHSGGFAASASGGFISAPARKGTDESYAFSGDGFTSPPIDQNRSATWSYSAQMNSPQMSSPGRHGHQSHGHQNSFPRESQLADVMWEESEPDSPDNTVDPSSPVDRWSSSDSSNISKEVTTQRGKTSTSLKSNK